LKAIAARLERVPLSVELVAWTSSLSFLAVPLTISG
jgi:hypothetical protein